MWVSSFDLPTARLSVGVRVVVGFDLMLNVVKLFLQPLHALFKCLDALFYLGVLMAVLRSP